MEEIKVGEYIRTEEGLIGKVEEINKEPTEDDVFYVCTDNFDGLLCEIVKHSFNIIDLIEVGDIVEYKTNALSYPEVAKVKKHRDGRTRKESLRVEFWDLEQIEILNIVTHEQFENVKYKVGE